MSAARRLADALREPARAAAEANAADWNAIIAAARAEQLIGSLADRMTGLKLPGRVEEIFDGARRESERQRVQALWECEMARRALAPMNIPILLLKGSAFHAAGLDAAAGRSVGDLDLLVPRHSLDEVERRLIDAGWERLKEADGYDDLYYRRWMHEIPPLIHRERDRMIDVHHTIIPPTARPTPDAEALIADRVALDNGLFTLSAEDMVIHGAAHLLADGDLAGGLRNLWDLDRLLRQFGVRPGFWTRLEARAQRHELESTVSLALRLCARLFATPVDPKLAGRNRLGDRWFEARLLARNGWGQPVRPALRLAFYVRSHWLRMPPLMLARHLWAKATG